MSLHSHPLISSSRVLVIAWIVMALFSSFSTISVHAFSSSPQPLHKAQLHTSAAAWRCETGAFTSASGIHKLSSSSFSQSSFTLSTSLLNLSSKPDENQDEDESREAAAAASSPPPPKPTTSRQVISSETASRAPASVSAAAQQAQERARMQQQAANEKPPPRPMDPLVRSLTRIDETATDKNAPTKQIPFFGEVVLDRSFYLFVPAAIFAILGFIMSITIILNSGDAIVANLATTTTTTTDSSSINTPQSSDCRGICSSQEQDLEGLRNFMSNFGKY